ncbi:hypothetical protein [Allosediminivita pacifica]|uniref:HNH endonuclease n=1 Tax=Allosediminivita pacifica TaxID=1267769 RepID=A0A2T6AZF9_9RHOB|nr:hypothetical protein [Allosediminivita pacifica]PTX49198.1 hypothetical protein C8N44_10738 [Allosediminivita pacifica]GGB05919.1 hypothetical protein GCM10011324_15100 [Allosediminivita pacifica]
MGQKKRRLERLKKDHPFCCFCGGTRETETIEHAPPKAFFKDKARLRGLEFPACKRCNNGSSQLDQVASWVAYGMGLIRRDDPQDGYWEKLSRGVKNNTPDALECIQTERAERIWWWNGYKVEAEAMSVPMGVEIFQKYLNPWAAKLGYALWYNHTSTILPPEGRVWVRWITNDAIIKDGLPEVVSRMPEITYALMNGKKESADQFHYRAHHDKDNATFIFFVGAHSSSGIAIAASEKHAARIGEGAEASTVFNTSERFGIQSIERH